MEDNNIMAFPLAVPQPWEMMQEGMTLRDWFAGQALAGLMGHPALAPLHEGNYPLIADRAYLLADEMLKLRKD